MSNINYSTLPIRYLKIDRLSKSKTVIKFYRNHLSLDMFTPASDNKYIFKESFDYHGVKVELELIISANVFSETLFRVKEFKLTGQPEQFTIFSRLNVKEFPGCICGKTENISYIVKFDGHLKSLYAQRNTKLQKEAMEKNRGLVEMGQLAPTTLQTPVSSTVKWNMCHPLQGGRVSPK